MSWPCWAPKARRRVGRFTAWVLAVGGVVGLLAACSTGDGSAPAAVDSPATSSTTTPAAGGTGSSTGGGNGAAAGDSGDTAASFDGDTAPDISSVREGYPVLVSVTEGEHDGYRRYVFTFRHADPEGHQPWRQHARPGWDARWVPASQAVMDGSGDPVANAGAAAHLRIAFQADMHDAEGRSTLERSVADEPPDLVFGGDFENQVTWFYGAAGERPFRVFYVGEGRVAVDIAR